MPVVHVIRRIGQGLRFLWVDRSTRTLIVAGVLIVAIGLVRPSDDTGLIPGYFWWKKVATKGKADVVIAGDSRVLNGVSPQAMDEGLPDRRILNYGFLGAGYSAEYLDATAATLRPDGPGRIIVLGITPHSLCRFAMKENDFREQRKLARSAAHRFKLRWMSKGMHFVEPIDVLELRMIPVRFEGQVREYRRYFRNGWVAVRRDVIDHETAVRRMRGVFKEQGRQVDPEAVNHLMATVRRWRGEGIAVYAFRPPNIREMFDMEDAVSGFDEAAFAKAFEQAGGVWLSFPADAYDSHDGTHLSEWAAREFSRDLSRRIRNIQKGQAP